jgi:hypothetical protein
MGAITRNSILQWAESIAKVMISSALKWVVSPPPRLAELNPGAATDVPHRHRLRMQRMS